MTDKIAKDLYAAGLREAFISVDGENAEIHDMQRGIKGSFDKTLRGIKILKANGFTVDLSCIPTKINIKALDKLPSLAKSLGCSSITFGGWFPKQGMRGTGGDLTPDKELMTNFLQSFRALGEKEGMPMHTSRLVPHMPLEACPAGTSIIGLDATGYWHPCLNIPADHSDNTDALKVSIVDALSIFKSKPEHPTCAKHCPDGNDCYGGCPADKINGVDRICANRKTYKAIKLEVR